MKNLVSEENINQLVKNFIKITQIKDYKKTSILAKEYIKSMIQSLNYQDFKLNNDFILKKCIKMYNQRTIKNHNLTNEVCSDSDNSDSESDMDIDCIIPEYVTQSITNTFIEYFQLKKDYKTYNIAKNFVVSVIKSLELSKTYIHNDYNYMATREEVLDKCIILYKSKSLSQRLD